MFINFVDSDGDQLSLNVNHIVGFEFPVLPDFHPCKTGDCPHDQQKECDEQLRTDGMTKVQLITGKMATVKEDRETIADMFKQIHNHTNLPLWWDFQPMPQQNVAPSP